jgi:hypothetical protein
MGQTIQVRVSDRCKQLYEKAAAKAGVSLSDWVRARLDKAANVTLIDRLVLSPAEVSEHQARNRPRDEEGRRILEEEEAAEIRAELEFEEEFPNGIADDGVNFVCPHGDGELCDLICMCGHMCGDHGPECYGANDCGCEGFRLMSDDDDSDDDDDFECGEREESEAEPESQTPI